MARRQGASREHVLRDLRPRSNAGTGPFSTQPSGPQFFGRISASLARPVSQTIQTLRSLLEIRPNSLRRLASHTGYTTLVPKPKLRNPKFFCAPPFTSLVELGSDGRLCRNHHFDGDGELNFSGTER